MSPSPAGVRHESELRNQRATSYSDAGVSLDAGDRTVQAITKAVRSTYGPEVLAGIGAFGGVFDASALQGMKSPVLVASTDGVGTKTQVAARMRRWASVGRDLVNHCVNDILVQGARPLFFLDYVGVARLEPEQVASVVAGLAEGCRQAKCALLGGETAEMPSIYRADEIDLVGTIIGIAERAELIDGASIVPGDVIVGLPSSGLHTNGYSLARRVLSDLDWDAPRSELGESIGDALLAVHRSYLEDVNRVRGQIKVIGLAHITGGGIEGNLPRILPPGTGALLRRGAWPEHPIFGLIQRTGNVADSEMFRAFNMGLGMLMVVSPADAKAALGMLTESAFEVGEVVAGNGEIEILGVN